jgi:hypothetical protein
MVVGRGFGNSPIRLDCARPTPHSSIRITSHALEHGARADQGFSAFQMGIGPFRPPLQRRETRMQNEGARLEHWRSVLTRQPLRQLDAGLGDVSFFLRRVKQCEPLAEQPLDGMARSSPTALAFGGPMPDPRRGVADLGHRGARARVDRNLAAQRRTVRESTSSFGSARFTCEGLELGAVFAMEQPDTDPKRLRDAFRKRQRVADRAGVVRLDRSVECRGYKAMNSVQEVRPCTSVEHRGA